MNETPTAYRRGRALHRTALPAVLLFCLAAATAVPVRLHAQTPTTTDITEETVPLGSGGTDTTLQDEGAPPEECHPPSTQEWVLIGVGTLVIFVVCFFLLVRLVQRAFIHRDKNATLGRHFGISITFLVGSLGMTALAYLITGCLHRQFVLWLCFPLALWAIHGLYTLIVVRNE
jgi:hypothetical protein